MSRVLRNIAIVILLCSCSAAKYLKEDEKFFEGHEVTYLNNEKEVPKDVRATILSDIDPEATRKFFLSRPGTWLYYQVDSLEKDKGLKYFIKYRLGNKPSLLSEVNIPENEEIIESRLKASGFLRATVETRIDSSKNTAKVVYELSPHQAYYFDSLSISPEPYPWTSELTKSYFANPRINAGELFRKNSLVAQRTAITSDLRNQGYFYFSPSLLLFQADSSRDGRTVKVNLELKQNTPQVAIEKFIIDTVTVNLASNSSNTEIIGDSLRAIVDPDRLFIKPEKLRPFVVMKPGQTYNRKDEILTLEHLNKLEVFDFVSLNFEVDTSAGKNHLNANILGSPRPKHSLRSEVVLTTTSTNFTGPGLQLRYTNRNLFGGAEQLRISTTGRYEQQLTGSRRGLTSFEIDFSVDLLIPRVSGLIKSKELSGNVPKTKYSISYRIFDQPDYYAQSSLGASYGYQWLSNQTTFHDLNLLRLDYVRLLRSSERLEELFENGTLDRESFNDQLIFGPSYSLTYSPKRRAGFASYFVGASLELSGNILYTAYSLSDRETNEDGQYEVVRVPFAQYARSQFDTRMYLDAGDYTQLVFRQNLGVGVPYLNSSSLPFAKQFFVGGASSLRGFPFRSVGPGSYVNTENTDDSFFDQTGDIMLEWNAESRFDLGGYLKGALFIDAGNVWLINEASNRPGGRFDWNDFLNELAVSGGAGLRIDADFIVVRFDLALPLRSPALEDGDRWLFDEMALNNSWVGDNLILNFAIGYPF
ncbi:MAG: BamA/TamA family outer membrane protein [Bacteroidota bacterium]